MLKKLKILSLILICVLVPGLAARVILGKDMILKIKPSGILNSSIKQVSAQEIYPIFQCPCCGKSIDQCTCPMAKERMAFVDGLTSGKMSEEEAVLVYTQKYGLESFIDEKRKDAFREKLVQAAPDDRPIISLDSGIYDFGQVSQAQGEASTIFEIKNEGKDDLIIERMETSCGCTTASIIYQGNEGPRFGMPGHGLNEEIDSWQVGLLSGETAQLKVYYDPSVHLEFRGSATRTVSIFSNDPVDFEKKVSIELNQVD